MRSVFKYQLAFTESNKVEMPRGSRLIHFAIQHGLPCVWADVVPDNPPEIRNLAIHGTGHSVGICSRHIGSVMDNGFAWHLFDVDGLP